ncbi:hypothetical protein [Niallia sp. MER TA 168]|uniref:hypothetical protein n=1 Tax=Niallia sp. MER TA 168 TaxID=2939568 RepID=UPI0020418AED|nr:hypothetical protein [Niallia sp. MER TA 168]MCM3363176.1 hypothetical protein [Niallia sp. MER TA 168]
MFNVGNKNYTVKLNKEKFKQLDPRVSADLFTELISKYEKSNGISDQSLEQLFILGLEEEKTGKRVPRNEAERHYEKLTDKNGSVELKKLITAIMYRDRPDFFQAINAMK